MTLCPFCQIDVPDVAYHFGGYKCSPCPDVLYAFGPDEPRLYNIREVTDYPLPDSHGRDGNHGGMRCRVPGCQETVWRYGRCWEHRHELMRESQRRHKAKVRKRREASHAGMRL